MEQDGDAASVTDDDTDVTSKSAGSSSTAGRIQKPKKPDKHKMPPVTKKGLKGESRGVDPGYMSGESQGQQHSPLKGYGSPPAPQEGDMAGGQWKHEDEITNILRHQTLSDPNDPTSPMAMAFSPHCTGGGGYVRSPQMGPEGSAVLQMDQVTNHMTNNTAANHPNGKASRQGRGGGLAVPAGQTPGNPQAPPMPAKTFHHHPSHNQQQQQQQPGGHLTGHQQLPPPSYHQPPMYSQSRPNHYNPFLMPPLFQSFPSGYSSLPAELRQPQPPSSVPYTQLPHHHQLRENENTPISHAGGATTATGPGGNLQTPSSSGYSSCGSPKGVHRKSPSDDSSVAGAASIHSNPMTNSYSTFSSNSSRLSSPGNGSNRGDGVHHIPVGGPLQQNQYSKTSPRGGGVDPTKPPYPLQQSLRMSSGSSSTTARNRLMDDTMSESSGRSWVYSSQSSRYSTFSELSDEVLERLPTDQLRRHSFTKAQPLPLPESMQEQFEAKLNGTGVITGMECSPPHGNGTGALLGDTFQHPQSPISMQLDFHGDKTMPLYHLPPESAALFTPNDAHLPFYSNSQCTADTFDFQMNYNENGGGANIPNVMFTDMVTPFTNTGLPNDDTQYLETLLSSQAN